MSRDPFEPPGTDATVIALNPYVEQAATAPVELARLGDDAFLGRDDLLARLEALFRDTVFSRSTRGVVLHGPEGIGRRSVARRFERNLQGAGARFVSLWVQPVAGAPVNWVRQLLLDWFHDEVNSSRPVQNVVAALRRLVPTHEVVEVSVAVADVLDLELQGEHAAVEAARRLLADPLARQPFLTDVIRRLLQREAERQPLILTLPHPEQADAEGLQVIVSAAAGVRNAPLLLVSLQLEAQLKLRTGQQPRRKRDSQNTEALDHPSMFRGGWSAPRGGGPDDTGRELRAPASVLQRLTGYPEVADAPTTDATQIVDTRRPQEAGGDVLNFGVAIELIAVGRLSDMDMETLVRRVFEGVQDVPEELIGMLLTDLEGVPGRLDARLTALKSHRVLERDPLGRWGIHLDRLMGESLPSDLDALAQARLRGLSDKHRHILELAAIVGPRFHASSVLALMRIAPQQGETPFREQRTESRLRQVLLDVQGRDIIVYEPAGSPPGDQLFSFALERERQLLLDSVELEDRRMLHRFVAQLLENHGAPLEEVARHWEMGAAGRRAAIARLRAGINHFEQFRPAQAIEALESAVSQLDIDEGSILFEGLAGLAQSYLLTGELQRVRTLCDRLASYAWALGDVDYGAMAMLWHGTAARRLGDFRTSEELLTLALELTDQMEDPDEARHLRADILDELVSHRWQHGDHIREALDFAEKSLAIRTELEDTAGMARTVLNIGKIQYSRKRLDNARACFERAIKLSESHGIKNVLADAQNALGVLAITENDPETAQRLWTETLELSRQLGDRALRATVLSNLGEVAWLKGDVQLAREFLNRSVELARSIGDLRISAESIRLLSQIALRELELDAAASLANVALSEARQSGTKLSVALALRNKAEVLGTTLFQDTFKEPNDAQTMATALPLSHVERVEEADRSFRESAALLESMGDKMHLRETLESYRIFLAERGRVEEAEVLEKRLRP